MNIIEKLKGKNIHTQIKYYGLNDLSTGISINEFLEGKKIILENYIDFAINDIDSYIDYVYLEHILNSQNNGNDILNILINDCSFFKINPEL